jgi:hypothetical protein
MNPAFAPSARKLTELGKELTRLQIGNRLLDAVRSAQGFDEADKSWVVNAAVSAGVSGLYTGMEDILRGLLSIVDQFVPTGESSHQDILDQAATAIDGTRPCQIEKVFWFFFSKKNCFLHTKFPQIPCLRQAVCPYAHGPHGQVHHAQPRLANGIGQQRFAVQPAIISHGRRQRLDARRVVFRGACIRHREAVVQPAPAMPGGDGQIRRAAGDCGQQRCDGKRIEVAQIGPQQHDDLRGGGVCIGQAWFHQGP